MLMAGGFFFSPLSLYLRPAFLRSFFKSSSSLLRSNMFSSACMFDKDSPTLSGSLASHLSAAIGP